MLLFPHSFIYVITSKILKVKTRDTTESAIRRNVYNIVCIYNKIVII